MEGQLARTTSMWVQMVYGQTERQQNPNFSDLTPAQQPQDNWATAPTQPCPTGNTGDERYPV
jgi:hypothetical protein